VQKQNHFEELYDRAHKTAVCRFFAHVRLRDHHNASLWTITFFSMGLIFVPLIQIFELETRFTTNYTNFIQVVLAIVILVISVMLNMTNFSVRADKMHQCGMILNAFVRRIHRHIVESSTPEIYEELVKEYDAILQRYENHSPIDYLFAKNHLTGSYQNPWYFPIYIRVRYAFQFFPYLLLLGLEVSWFYMLAR
jgi:hypothetical protein